MNTDIQLKRQATQERLRARIEDLPTLPSVAVRILMMDRESDSFFDELLQLLSEDPPFAARLLHLSNSALSSPTVPVTTLRGGLARLGTSRVTNLLVSAAVTQVFVPTTKGQRNLWIHSVQAATAAQLIAEQLGLDSEHAYVAGLLHDIGRFVMFHESPEELDQIDEEHWMDGPALVSAEQGICGFDHAELGWRACVAWSIPEEIAILVRDHHRARIQDSELHSSAQKSGIAVIQAADALSMAMLYHEAFLAQDIVHRAQMLESAFSSCQGVLPLPAPRLAAMVETVLGKSEAAASALGLDVPE